MPALLDPAQADGLLAWALDEVAWQRETFSIFGKQQLAPRRIAWFGDPGVCYRYTGLDHEARAWPTALLELRDIVQRWLNHDFNYVLANRYDDGSHYMGWHRDQERGCSKTIASVSLGAERKFKLRTDERTVVDYWLAHGSGLSFDGNLAHKLPLTRKPMPVRVNLTFRLIQ